MMERKRLDFQRMEKEISTFALKRSENWLTNHSRPSQQKLRNFNKKKPPEFPTVFNALSKEPEIRITNVFSIPILSKLYGSS